MIPVTPPPEPPDFNALCRIPGLTWLANHPRQAGGRLPNYWRRFIPALGAGFQRRCGYLAMLDLDGTVDHFLSTDNQRHLAYEWNNYRYATGWLNSSKQAIDQQVLDPFEVREEWFEIDLATLHLRLTVAVPNRLRPRAEFTLRRLQLDYGPRVIKKREYYYGQYQQGAFPLDYLDQVAPLVATAVRRGLLLAHLAQNPPVRSQEAATICQAPIERTRALLHAWRAAGHISPLGRGAGTRYQQA